MKFLYPQKSTLEWQPASWKADETPVLGPYKFEVSPIPDVEEAQVILAKNRKDMADTKICYDQVSYNAYMHAFKKLSAHEPVFFVGPPGTCKTFVISKVSADVGIPLLKVPALDMDPVRARRILFGGLTTSDEAPWKILEHRAYAGTLSPHVQEEVAAYRKGRTEMKSDDWKILADKLGYIHSVAHFEPGAVTKGAKHGYIVFIDELNKFTPAALTDLTQMLSGQSIQLENGEWISMREAHPNFRLAFAMNQAGPLHPDREPLVRELMSRLSRHMMIIPEMDSTQEQQFLMFQWLGEQPTVKLPDASKFSAKALAPNKLFSDLIDTQNTKPIRELAEKFIKARMTSKEQSRKMEGGDNTVPREHTTETWPYDRRDLIVFANDITEIFQVAETQEMAKTMFKDVIDRHLAQHFTIYNLDKGTDVIQEFNANVTKAGLFQAFDDLLHTITNVHQVKLSKDDPKAIDTNAKKLAEMIKGTYLASGREKPICHCVRIPKDPGHPARKGDTEEIKQQAKLLESLMLAQKKITPADVKKAVEACKTGYPIGMQAYDEKGKIEGWILKFPEFKEYAVEGETLQLVAPVYLMDVMKPYMKQSIANEIS
jgi:MoxR-like ATPase